MYMRRRQLAAYNCCAGFTDKVAGAGRASIETRGESQVAVTQPCLAMTLTPGLGVPTCARNETQQAHRGPLPLIPLAPGHQHPNLYCTCQLCCGTAPRSQCSAPPRRRPKFGNRPPEKRRGRPYHDGQIGCPPPNVETASWPPHLHRGGLRQAEDLKVCIAASRRRLGTSATAGRRKGFWPDAEEGAPWTGLGRQARWKRRYPGVQEALGDSARGARGKAGMNVGNKQPGSPRMASYSELKAIH
jgi:hypothetical protein